MNRRNQNDRVPGVSGAKNTSWPDAVMTEQPQSFWKRSWTGGGAFLRWFVIVGAASFVLLFCSGLLSGAANKIEVAIFSGICAVALALISALVIASYHWIRHWPNLRRVLFGLACAATVIALF